MAAILSPFIPSTPNSPTSSAFSSDSFATASSLSSPSATSTANIRRTPAQAVRLPLRLPDSPTLVEEVDVTTLVVDDDWVGIPTGYILAKMRSFGPKLLAASIATCLHVPSGPRLPDYLVCTTAAERAFAPTHVFAVTSPDSNRTLLLPLHGLLWAARSPSLAVLSSHPRYQPPHISLPATIPPPIKDDQIALPVIRLNLPSSLAFPILHSWITSPCSPSDLLSSLLSPTRQATADDPSLTSDLSSLSSLPTTVLLSRISLIHGLWQDVVALEIGEEADRELWATMRAAWSILVGALAEAKRRQRE